MKIENTELECSEVEEMCLRRYLGKDTETMEAWAQRVWSMCEAKSKEDPEKMGQFEKRLPRVYKAEEGQTWQERAQHLWEQKKQKRREAMCREFSLVLGDDAEIMKLKTDKKYKTADEMFDESLVRLNG